MKRLEIILAAAMSVSLSGCKLLAKKPAAASTPPPPAAAAQPLSTPQTQVVLPLAQPVEPGALATAPPPPDMAPSAPPSIPASNGSNRPAGRVPPSRSGAPPPVTPPPKPEAQASPAETPRPQIQEILPADVQQKLLKAQQDSVRQARQLVAQARKRRLSAQELEAVTSIEQFISISEDKAKAGDMRTADDMAARALSLAKDLQSGK
jgi:hypothetical protein